jgi:hypothetical protein
VLVEVLVALLEAVLVILRFVLRKRICFRRISLEWKISRRLLLEKMRKRLEKMAMARNFLQRIVRRKWERKLRMGERKARKLGVVVVVVVIVWGRLVVVVKMVVVS